MTKGFKHRLSYRLTRDTVLIAMVLGLVLNVVQITLDYFGARHSMEEDIQALIEVSHNPASQIAYNIDVRLAEELLDGLLRHPATIDARIVDSENSTMAAASKSSPVSPYRWISDELFGASRVFSRELRVSQLNNLPLGQLVLTIDTYHYGLQFLERASYTLISGLLKSLILSASLLGIFYLILTRPMLSVIGALSEVKASSPEKIRLPTPPGHQHDEIGTMVGIINQHLETIDLTLAQLRMAESTMKNYSSELEQEVESRTREISDKNQALQRGNRALVKAKEDAMRRARARANFLASMSHEIRTPLNGVLGMLGLALEGEQDSAKRHRLQIALSAGESLLSILNDILDISKVEAGKLNLEHIPFDMHRLIEECATLHTQQARKKGIDLIAETDLGFPSRFLGDPTRIRQILNNLLSNAIKFTDSGSVCITAHYSAGILTIDVSDTGIGMSKEGLRRIFSPFSQADTQTTRLYGGTGLGLTLCRQLVERMHGEIKVDSKEQQGTRFTITVPLPVYSNLNSYGFQENSQESSQEISRRAELPESIVSSLRAEITADTGHLPVSTNETPGAPQQRALRILLVEDNEVNQILASTLLKKMGHYADVTENGELAIKALEQRHYDLVLMDCQMPVMDGFETTRRIRKNPAWRELPVIAVTANVMQGDRDDCFACGMNDYITKPYNRSQLSAAIMRWAPFPAPQ
ncbi:Signal transduction histidine kinase [Marinobacter antarcticus]|uniref:histidine kinase n=1 Tax=Marinobacter antarcticus TaxID=564117 RepID=A0A1M6SF18_9GAMM|nr:ATP-binding protein [Marinobacter antarcticus]SHK43321.1 Signal transduction histidine kinase [Marinobacter antarcticus]